MRSASLSKRLAAMGGHAEAQNASATIDLSCRQMQLGEAHPGTLASLNNLAGLLKGQGKLAEAGAIAKDAIETMECDPFSPYREGQRLRTALAELSKEHSDDKGEW